MNSADVTNERPIGPNNAELVNQDSFERLRSKNRRKEIRRRIFYFLVALILIAAVGIVCVVLFFNLKTVDIRGNSHYSSEEILEACGFTPNTNLFGLKTEQIEAAIIRACPYIREVSFRRILPSTLLITVSEDAPRYCAEIYGSWFLLSENLRVISRHTYYEEVEVLDLDAPITYLILSDVDYAVVGERIRFPKDSYLDYLTAFLKELASLPFYEKVDCIDARDRYHLALYASGGRFYVELGNSESLDTKLRFVARVIEDPSFDERTIASINVEYVSQVIVLLQDKPFSYR